MLMFISCEKDDKECECNKPEVQQYYVTLDGRIIESVTFNLGMKKFRRYPDMTVEIIDSVMYRSFTYSLDPNGDHFEPHWDQYGCAVFDYDSSDCKVHQWWVESKIYNER